MTTSCSSTIGCGGCSYRKSGASASCGDDIGECDRAKKPVWEASVSHDLVLCKHGSASATSVIGKGDGDLERGRYGLAESRFESDAYDQSDCGPENRRQEHTIRATGGGEGNAKSSASMKLFLKGMPSNMLSSMSSSILRLAGTVAFGGSGTEAMGESARIGMLELPDSDRTSVDLFCFSLKGKVFPPFSADLRWSIDERERSPGADLSWRLRSS
jgi:hypothetical protein